MTRKSLHDKMAAYSSAGRRAQADVKRLLHGDKPKTLPEIKARFRRLVSRMTPKEAEAYLIAHRIYAGGMRNGAIRPAGRLGDPGLKYLTGGFSSQTLDSMVIRRLGVRAGIVKNPR